MNGLLSVIDALRELWGAPVDLGQPETLVGPAECVGSYRPLPSSAVRVTIHEHAVWLACPTAEADPSVGAAIFLHAGRRHVMPAIRLCCLTGGNARRLESVEYCRLDEWLHDALCRWQFPKVSASNAGGPKREKRETTTIVAQIRAKGIDSSDGLGLIARILRYAILGVDERHRYSLAKRLGIILPVRPQWLRPVVDTPLGRASATRLVLTAGLDLAEETEDGDQAAVVPHTQVRANRFRIQPNQSPDLGIDPVHTTEGKDIRLIGRLGEGVTIRERKLIVDESNHVSLSCSAAQIPFAGHDDPRRLLMAANMQMQAVPLDEAEAPMVHTCADNDLVRPGGVNLRVAYLAWEGLNHEDAWVVSQSAAERLTTTQTWTQTVAVRSYEQAVQVLVEEGDRVTAGQALVQRHIAPVLLSNDLGLLARLEDLDEEIPVDAADGIANTAATVQSIEIWDFVKDIGVPPDWVVGGDVRSCFRQVVRITLARELPLQVGDKLANRHGHKGIVGEILADEDMPRWQGKPLDALTDPISVLNRSNWGQVFETIFGRQGRIEVQSAATASQLALAQSEGQCPIEPPSSGRWIEQDVMGVAGIQFVMRLPHIARDKLSASPSPDQSVKNRAQRYGEMDHWALWAHCESLDAGPGRRWGAVAERLARLLAAAGFECSLRDDAVIVRQLALDEAPPPEHEALSIRLDRRERVPAEILAEVDAIQADQRAVFVFDPPVESVRLPRARSSKSRDAKAKQKDEPHEQTICWLPIISLADRPRHEELDRDHPLTLALRKIVHAQRTRKKQQKDEADEAKKARAEMRLRRAIQRYMQTAYSWCVGECATGADSSKASLLRRGLMGQRLTPSVRATAAPAGLLGLALDEVGLPLPLARALLGKRARSMSEEQVAAELSDRRFWLKRDPVLHRWGLLPVKAQIINGPVIRLTASILDPMGADFDGDTVAMFAELPGQPETDAQARPPRIAWDSSLKRAMFVPGKQYIYGLALLASDERRLGLLNQSLKSVGAPSWNVKLASTPKDAFQDWVEASAALVAEGRWWAILEEHAISALVGDAGMGLVIRSAEEISQLPVVQCGAAKADVFDAKSIETRSALERVLDGRSLEIYERPSAECSDPIADVMVAAKESIGRFGGALRRLLFTAPKLDVDLVRDAQMITEQATQRALSVKAGKKPLPYSKYNKHLGRILKGEPRIPADNEDLERLFDDLAEPCDRLCEQMKGSPIWLRWLRNPQELAALLVQVDDGAIVVPADDVRVASWLRPRE